MTDYTTWIKKATPQEVKIKASSLSIQEISELLPLLTIENNHDWSLQLVALIYGISDLKILESFGKILTPYQFYTLLEVAPMLDPEHVGKLYSLFIGIPTPSFMDLLAEITPHQLNLLKQPLLMEPIHYQLTRSLPEFEQQVDRVIKATIQLEVTLKSLEIETLGLNEIGQLKFQLNTIEDQLFLLQEKLKNALELSWNAERADLVEDLSPLFKECKQLDEIQLGRALDGENKSTGLWHILDTKCSSVFGHSLNGKDNAMEGMLYLSMWYPIDFWQVGLLPEVGDPKELQDLQKRDYWLGIARTHLEKLGLKTIKDLKNSNIVSKQCLKDYINKFS